MKSVLFNDLSGTFSRDIIITEDNAHLIFRCKSEYERFIRVVVVVGTLESESIVWILSGESGSNRVNRGIVVSDTSVQ